MADETKPAPRKRTARKTTTKPPEEPQGPTVGDSNQTESAGRSGSSALVTTESRAVAKVAEPDPSSVDEPLSIDALNAITFGRLVVHYPARDVDLFMDGSTAERVLAVFSGRSPKSVLQDVLVPGASSMANMWATFDIEGPLAISWLPGIRSATSRRMTVDPPAEGAIG